VTRRAGGRGAAVTDGPDVRALRYMAGHPIWRGPPTCVECPFAHPVPDFGGLFRCDLLHPGLALAVNGREPPCTGAQWRERARVELDLLECDNALLAAVAGDAREESSMYARGLAEGAAAEREACCKAVCPSCRGGSPVREDGLGAWVHPDVPGRDLGTHPCAADAIRRRAEDDGR
jgi:hypothetical protein